LSKNPNLKKTKANKPAETLGSDLAVTYGWIEASAIVDIPMCIHFLAVIGPTPNTLVNNYNRIKL